MKRTRRIRLYGAAVAVTAAAVPGIAQEVTGRARLAQRHHHNQRQATSRAGPEIRRRDPRQRRSVEGLVGAAVVPPKGAPNVLLIMTDDVGFGAPSTFGGVIPTPTLDRLAKSGLRYTQFHSTALCSPTRAALITGATITRRASAWSPSSPPVSPATTASSRKTRPPSAASSGTTATPPPGSARTTTRRPSRPARSGRSTNGPSAWASSISTASWAATPASGSRTSSATPRPSIPTSAIRAGT